MLWLFGIVACTPIVTPPDGWPASGCEAPAPAGAGDGVVDRRELADDAWRLEASDGAELEVRSEARRDLDCMAAVLMIPPGLDAGAELAATSAGQTLAEAGLYVVSFDPRGRGESEGHEDVNGAQGQDDVAALLRVIASQPWVDPTRVVVHSRSFGGALATGAMARHADLAPIGWVDYESPGWLSEDLEHTTEHTRERFQALAEESGDVEAFWAEREPAGFVGEVRPPYRRLQGWPDHAVDYEDAALAMLNGAVSAEAVYLNGEPVTGTITADELRERAIGGGIEPWEDVVLEQILVAAAN